MYSTIPCTLGAFPKMRRGSVKLAAAADADTPTPVPPPPNTRSILDALSFAGPGPEIINARVAMLAVPMAAYLENSSSKTTLDSMVHSPVQFAALVGFISAASLIPIMKGVRYEGLGLMTPKAELYNGRAAMVGFVVLLLIEAKYGVCFF